MQLQAFHLRNCYFTISHVQGSTSFSPRLQIVLRINSLSRSLMIVLHRDTVYARNFREGEGWLPGHIVEVAGPVSYNIQLDDGVTQWEKDKLQKDFSTYSIN